MDYFIYDFRVDLIEGDELSWRLIIVSFVYIFVEPSAVLFLLFVHYDGTMFEVLL